MGSEDVYEELERLRRRVIREVDRILSELAALKSDLTPDGGLRPLYTLYEYPDRYVILLDLPAADTSTLTVTATEGKLVVEARLEREISLGDLYGTVYGRETRISYYKHVIPLPPDADLENIRVNVRPNKIVEIVVPKKE